MLEDAKPTSFSGLVRISGFSHGTDVWLGNAQELIRSGTCKVTDAISARDDIMSYLIHMGMEDGLAFKIMEQVRKGKGLQDSDIQAMKTKSVPAWYIESCQKIKYLFPKAHATAYVLMSFRIAYCKVHYPLAFYATYFTCRVSDFDAHFICGADSETLKERLQNLRRKQDASTKEKDFATILEVANEMICRGFRFRKVDLYESDATRFRVVEEELLPPLLALQGLGSSAAETIVAARQNGRFISVDDLRQRSRATKTVLEILRAQGCLDGMDETSQMTLFAGGFI